MAVSQAILERIKKAQNGENNFSSEKRSKYFSLKSGSVSIRVLPGEFGEEKLFYRKNGIHFLPNKERVICRKHTIGEECPICEEIAEIKNLISDKKIQIESLTRQGANPSEINQLEEEIKALDSETKKIYPLSRWLINVLVKGENYPKIYPAPYTVFKEIWNAYQTNYQDGTDILDPVEGHDFLLTKSGNSRTDTKYQITLVLKSKPIAEDKDGIDKILSNIYNLDEESVSSVPTYDIAKEAYTNYLNGYEPILVKKPQDSPSYVDSQQAEAAQVPQQVQKPVIEQSQQTVQAQPVKSAATSLAEKIRNKQ